MRIQPTALVVALAALLAVRTAAASYQVSAWTFGDAASLDAAADRSAVDEVDVDWYMSRQTRIAVSSDENSTFVAAAHARGVRVLATLSNVGARDFSPAIPHAILRTPARIAQHAAAAAALCVAKNYDGIDLDWEALRPTDRDRFSDFVDALAGALHAAGKTLAIAIHPKTAEPGDWSGPRAEDWTRIGAAVDEFKIMTYDYSGSWSPPGPIAPLDWADAVLAHAESLVSADKIMMGIPFYGYDWKRRRTTDVSWTSAQTLIARYAPTIERDPSNEASFQYVVAGVRHTVFFQDRLAIAAKLAMLRAQHPGIRGIAIWVMGDEDPMFWDEIAAQLR